jgi:hypothetical protein
MGSQQGLWVEPERMDDRPMTRLATLSDDGRYRYTLSRVWKLPDEQPNYWLWVMLNPSTADASRDDPTIRRCWGFTQRGGGNAMHVVNLYARRQTKPAMLWAERAAGLDIVGNPANDAAIRQLSLACHRIVVAWGTHGQRDMERCYAVTRLLARDGTMDGRQLHCLGRTSSGHPRHPLILANATKIEPFSWRS